MDLKFRRNLPLLLAFVFIVAVLVLGFGDQPIVAYDAEDDAAAKALVSDFLGLFDNSTTETAVSQDLEPAVSIESTTGSVLEVGGAQELGATVSSVGVTGTTGQAE